MDARERATAAILAAASSAGLDVDAGPLVVLRERANLVVHLAPHPVVARTPLWTARVRPDPIARLRLEVELSRWAVARGGSVVEPCAGALAGPHETAHGVVTLWPWVDGRAVTASAAGLGRELAALHAAVAGYPGPVPDPSEVPGYCARALRLASGAGVLAAAAADAALRELDDVAERLVGLLDGPSAHRLVPLHGDAHPGNAVEVGGRLTWWDLEDSWCGPVEWDVAVLAASLGADGQAAAEAYRTASGTDLDDHLLAVCGDLRRVQGVAWGALVRALSPTGT